MPNEYRIPKAGERWEQKENTDCWCVIYDYQREGDLVAFTIEEEPDCFRTDRIPRKEFLKDYQLVEE